MRIGLTGGIASGKSLVANIFVEYGAHLIDTDVIAREIVEPGTAGLAAVVEAFGPSVLDSTGALDRPAMRERIFSSASERAQLEAILHPKIRKISLERAEKSTHPYVIFAVPLLIETDFQALVDRVCVVDCLPELQLKRLMARDALDQARAEAIIAAQTSRDARFSAADDIIDNNRSIPETRAQVYRLHKRYAETS